MIVVVLMFGWDVGGWIVGGGLWSGVEGLVEHFVVLLLDEFVDCGLWSGDWGTDDWGG